MPKGEKEAHKRGLKDMWKSPGDEMLYKYYNVIINHGKATCFVTERELTKANHRLSTG